jgi:hypothetical protein
MRERERERVGMRLYRTYREEHRERRDSSAACWNWKVLDLSPSRSRCFSLAGQQFRNSFLLDDVNRSRNIHN